MLINICSLRNKLFTLSHYLDETSPDVVLINETHLSSTDSTPRIHGYQIAARTDGENRRGGVAIYCKQDLPFSPINHPVFLQDTAAISIPHPTLGDISVVTHYTPPYPTSHIYPNLFNFFTSRSPNCIFMGDYNAHHHYINNASTSNIRGRQLFSILQDLNLHLINAGGQHTRLDPSSGSTSLLDLAIATDTVANQLQDLHIGECIGSDHLPVHFLLQGPFTPPPPTKTRNLKKADWDIFKQDITNKLHSFPATDIASPQIADSAVDFLQDTILEALDKACPLRVVKKWNFRVSEQTLSLIRDKRTARRLAQRNPQSTILATTYRNIKARLAAAIKEEKQTQWKQACESLDPRNATKFWKTFKRLTTKSGETKPTRVRLPNGQLSTSDRETSNAFAAHLRQVHQTNQGHQFDARHYAMVTEYIQNHPTTFNPQWDVQDEPGDAHELLQRMSTNDLRSILNKCTNTSPGEDKLGYSILKQLPDTALRFMTKLFHFLLQIGYFPSLWKSAIGVMIPKPHKDHTTPGNFRPISLIRCLGKLLEKSISHKLITHLSSTGQLNPWQRAYLPHKEAGEHVHRLSTEVKTALSNGWSTGALFLDVEKAFDSVWQDGLKYKLSQLDMPVKVIRFLSSYLEDRTIAVRVGKSISNPVGLAAGTPQGSVLSPLLFIIFVNDIPFSLPDADPMQVQISQYADDLALWFSSRNSRKPLVVYNRINSKLQEALSLLETWCCKWRIKLNANKTQLIYFTSLRTPPPPSLSLFDTPILPSITDVVFLGTKFKEKSLTMMHHCKAKRQEAERRTRLLRRLRGTNWGCNTSTLLHLYKTFIRPVLETGYPTTVHASRTALHHLQVAQNKALRMALKVIYTPGQPRTTTEELHRRAHLDMMETRLQHLSEAASLRFAGSSLTPVLEDRLARMRRLPFPLSRRNR